MTTKKRTIISIFIVITLIAGAIIGIITSNYRSEKSAIEQAKTVLMDDAKEQAETLSVMLKSNYQYLELLSNSTAYESERTDEETTKMLEQLKSHGGFSSVFVLGLDGIVKFGDGIGTDYKDHLFFKESSLGSRSIDSIKTNEGSIVLSVPYYKNDEIVGVLTGIYNDEDLTKVITSEVYEGTGYTYIANSNGEVIINTTNEYFISSDQNLITFFEEPDINMKIKLQKMF